MTLAMRKSLWRCRTSRDFYLLLAEDEKEVKHGWALPGETEAVFTAPVRIPSRVVPQLKSGKWHPACQLT